MIGTSTLCARPYWQRRAKRKKDRIVAELEAKEDAE